MLTKRPSGSGFHVESGAMSSRRGGELCGFSFSSLRDELFGQSKKFEKNTQNNE
jgi:hypothetical protein